MAFGIYVHIPYCLQRCVYCDFATYETSQILPSVEYVEHLKKEIAIRSPFIGPQQLTSIYFGGGTPSLLEPPLLKSILNEISSHGFETTRHTEITLEINPATLNEEKLQNLLKAGFNRFSVGAQTFDDRLLSLAHRKHTAEDTRETLRLLKKYHVNFSFDLLFALPGQTLEGLKRDLEEVKFFQPHHVSPYCLTVPESNPMAANRPRDDIQCEMFQIIEEELISVGLTRYEISNFALPGFESRHNKIYWQDEEYWGIGLSSHSYLKKYDWGCRFWNPRAIKDYLKSAGETSWTLSEHLESLGEILQENQALTDYFHTSLRTDEGLRRESFKRKFLKPPEEVASSELKRLSEKRLIQMTSDGFHLTPQGRLLSNQVFQELTFL